MSTDTWPADWPEEKKTGPGFLAELMRRHPESVKVCSVDEAVEWLSEKPDKPKGKE